MLITHKFDWQDGPIFLVPAPKLLRLTPGPLRSSVQRIQERVGRCAPPPGPEALRGAL